MVGAASRVLEIRREHAARDAEEVVGIQIGTVRLATTLGDQGQGYDAARVLMAAIDSGATDRASIAAALPKVSYVGPRGPLEIDPATNNVVQNIYVYDTVMEGDALTQKVIGTVEAVRDEPNGCALH